MHARDGSRSTIRRFAVNMLEGILEILSVFIKLKQGVKALYFRARLKYVA